MTAALDSLTPSVRMPVLFLGHGSPMHAIEQDHFSEALSDLAYDIPKPDAVLVVSAHWLTPGGTHVLSTESPRTIHDFWGFPRELYEIEYPAVGAPGVAEAVCELSGATTDGHWGLDHASWSVLRHMWPEADVPVLEMSLDVLASPQAHVELARTLTPLRERGVLIVGSGNIVHNLRAVDWNNPHGGTHSCGEFDVWAADRIAAGDLDSLTGYASLGGLAAYAVPTNDHYLPMLYAAALRREDDETTFPYVGLEYGSVSMRCVRIG